MPMKDNAFGGSLLALLAALLTYYFFWVAVTPFVDADHSVQLYFPARKWALMIPTILFVTILTVTGTFVGLVMIKSVPNPSSSLLPRPREKRGKSS